MTQFILIYAGNYNINVTDVNGCSVDGSSPTSTTVNGLNALIPNTSVSSDYNGQDISCFGAQMEKLPPGFEEPQDILILLTE